MPNATAPTTATEPNTAPAIMTSLRILPPEEVPETGSELEVGTPDGGNIVMIVGCKVIVKMLWLEGEGDDEEAVGDGADALDDVIWPGLILVVVLSCVVSVWFGVEGVVAGYEAVVGGSKAELIGITSVLVFSRPSMPIMVCAVPSCRKKVPSPFAQLHVPAATPG